MFSHKCSYGHVKHSFANPIGTNLLEGSNIYSWCPPMIVKSYLFLSSFIGNCSYDLWERSFDKPDKSLLREGWDFFSQCMEVIKKYNLIKTVFFSLHDPLLF